MINMRMPVFDLVWFGLVLVLVIELRGLSSCTLQLSVQYLFFKLFFCPGD
jgi:hypothetical protein